MTKTTDILTIALLPFTPYPEDPATNLRRVSGYVRAAAKRGAQLLLLPAFRTDELPPDAPRALSELAAGHAVHIALCMPEPLLYAPNGETRSRQPTPWGLIAVLSDSAGPQPAAALLLYPLAEPDGDLAARLRQTARDGVFVAAAPRLDLAGDRRGGLYLVGPNDDGGVQCHLDHKTPDSQQLYLTTLDLSAGRSAG